MSTKEKDSPVTSENKNISDVSDRQDKVADPDEVGAAAATGKTPGTDSLPLPLVMSTLCELNSTLEAFSQALGDQASRVTLMEEKLGQMCVTPDIPSSVSVNRGQTNVESSTGAADGPRASLANQNQASATSARCDTGTRRFAKPQEFDGSAPWRSFIIQFESLADGHGWSSAERRCELVACLRGPALEVFSHLPGADRLDFQSLVASLESRFGVKQQEPWFRSQLRRRTRGAGESLPSLARDVERLVALAYPTAVQELRDSLACDHFVDALNDADLQIAVRQGRPGSLQEALAHAVEIDAIRRSVRPTGTETSGGSVFVRGGRAAEGDLSRFSQAADVPDAADALQQILHSLSELRQSLNRGPSGRGRGFRRGAGGSATPGTCWSCGEGGHMRRNCPRGPSPKISEN